MSNPLPNAAGGIPVPSNTQLGPEMVAELAKHPALNVHRYLALAPECYRGWNALLAGIYASGLDPKLRETVICRVGARARCDYELHQHTALARQNGVSDLELAAILSDEPVSGLDDTANLLCRVADELHGGGPLPDATLNELTERFDPRETMKWLILVGHYACVVRVLNAVRVPLEPEQLLAGEASPLG